MKAQRRQSPQNRGRECQVKTDNPCMFALDIAESVYDYYQRQLAAQNRIDFEDMINDAHFILLRSQRRGSLRPLKETLTNLEPYAISVFADEARRS